MPWKRKIKYVRKREKKFKMPSKRAILVGIVVAAAVGYMIMRPRPAAKADGLFSQGVQFRAAGDYQKAVMTFSKVIELVPDSAPAYCERGLAHLQRSAENLERVEEFDPFHPGVPRIKFKVSNSTAERLMAAADLEKAVAIDPKNAEAHYNLGIVRVQLGNLDKAIESQNAAIRLRGTNYRAYAGLASAYEGKGDTGKAVELYRRAVELSGDNDPDLYSSLGDVLEKNSKPDDARLAFQKALEIAKRLGYTEDTHKPLLDHARKRVATLQQH